MSETTGTTTEQAAIASSPPPGPRITEADRDRVLDVNLKGTFACAQAAARPVIAQGKGGAVVNIAPVDAFHPSSVGLATIPLGWMGTPGDIGRVALFLASDAAACMTGSTVFVDGGVLLS
jgi:NAD(P)-dependent dehydrogenase (short-subunit alcohol dehydrogenase family)